MTVSTWYGNGGFGVWGLRTSVTRSVFLNASGIFAPRCDQVPTASVFAAFSLPSYFAADTFSSKASFDSSSMIELSFEPLVPFVGAVELAQDLASLGLRQAHDQPELDPGLHRQLAFPDLLLADNLRLWRDFVLLHE